jgi:hypothetical protein
MHLITRPLTHYPVGLSMSNRLGIGGFVMFEFAGVLYRQDFYVPINLSGLDLTSAYSDELMKAVRVIWHRVQRVIESLTMTRFDHDL